MPPDKRITSAKSPQKPSIGAPAATLSTLAYLPVGAEQLARCQMAPEQLKPGDVQWLQRTVGNQVVQRLLASQAPPKPRRKVEEGQTSDAFTPEPAGSESVDHPVQVQRQGEPKIQRWPWSKKNKKKRQSSTIETEAPSEVPTTTPQIEPSGNDENHSFLQPRTRRPTVDQDGLEEMMRGRVEQPETEVTNDVVPNNLESEEEPSKIKSNKAPYNKHFRRFVKGSRKKVNLDKLGKAHKSAGSTDFAAPDYVNPDLAGQAADQYMVTVAVAQEQSDWWNRVKKMKSVGIRKIFQSPIKLIRKIAGGKGEQYLTKKVLKKENKLPEGEKAQEEAIEKATKEFHQVGHTWVRFSKRVGGKIQELYSYGFWPRKILDQGGWDMSKYVAGQVRHPDTLHEGDAEKRYHDTTVPAEKFGEALALAQAHYQAPPNYHLLDYNCTKFAREILKKASGTFPGKGVFPSFAFSPGQLFQQLNDLQKDPTGVQPNERIRGEDSEEDREIVKQIGEEQESRSRVYSNEVYGLTPKDPKDYPQGIYDKPLKTFHSIKASTELGTRLNQEVQVHHLAPDHDLTVTDEMTEKYGVGELDYEAQDPHNEEKFETKSVYVDLAEVIEPGSRPTHTLTGAPINYEQPKQPEDPGKLPENMTKPTPLQYMRYGDWHDMQEFGFVSFKELEELNEQQVANLAKLINMTPEALTRKIAELNGKTVDGLPPITSSGNRPNLPNLGLNMPRFDIPPKLPELPKLLNFSNQKPLNQLSGPKPPSQEGGNLDELLALLNSSSEQPKSGIPSLPPTTNTPSNEEALDVLLAQLNGEKPTEKSTPTGWGDIDEIMKQLSSGVGSTGSLQQDGDKSTQELHDTVKENIEEHQDERRDDQAKQLDVEEEMDDLDDDNDLDIPSEIDNPSVVSMMKYDEWDQIFEILGVSRSLFKDLNDEQIEAIADAIGKTPEAFKELIKGF